MFAAVERLAEAPPVSEQALREQHQIVVRLARTAKAILPVRFGTFVERDELERVVRARRDVLQEALRTVHGKAQMIVRVFMMPDSPRLPTRSRATTSGTDYLRARAALSKPTLPKIAKTITDAVRPLVSAERIDAGQGSVRVTINHLIERRQVRAYLTAVDAIVVKPEDAVVSGPWPPFAFVPDLLSSAMPVERLTP
jgi:hypothetical protein